MLRRQQVGGHDIVDIEEVARLATVAEDERGFAARQARHELGNDRGVVAVGILPRPEHIEVAQHHGLQSPYAAPEQHVLLRRGLVGAVRGDGSRRHRLVFGQPGIVTVDRRRRGKDESPHTVFLRGQQAVERAAAR